MIRDARTAADLKDRIRKTRMVIYVVTNDSLKSVWRGWEIGFVEDLECQRMKLSERAYEREEWERDKVEDTSVDEDIMIHEMFTSLRVKTE